MNCFKKILLSFASTLMLVMPSANAGLIDFGSAEKYTFAVGGDDASLILGSEANIIGSVATTGLLRTAHGVNVQGDACYGHLVMDGPTTLGNDLGNCGELSQLEHDILLASQAATALGEQGAAINLGFVGTSHMLSAGIYNIDSLLLGGGHFLDINAAVNEYVIVNISNSALIASGAGIRLTGGISAQNVIFNFNNAVTSTFNFGGANVSGTFLGINAAYIMGDGATLNDVRFYTNHFLQANVQTVRTAPAVLVKEPLTVLMFLGGLFILLMRSNAKHV